MNRKSV